MAIRSSFTKSLCFCFVQVDRHLSRDCRSSNVVRCPYEHAGCKQQVTTTTPTNKQTTNQQQQLSTENNNKQPTKIPTTTIR
jgi:hypothetical protein